MSEGQEIVLWACGDWQEFRHGDYVILAPTDCRYPVQADQFERNYAEVGSGAERASEAA